MSCCYDEEGNPEVCTGPAKEEPDCGACNDRGCPACEGHEENCACSSCTELPDPELGYTRYPIEVDEVPF